MAKTSFFEELKERRVFQVAAIYVAVAWGVTEIVVTIADKLPIPAWVSTVAVIAFIVGFPIAMFLAWTFDITPEGVQRTSIASRRGKVSIVAAVALLVISTVGLFILIKPAAPDISLLAVYPNSIAVMPFDNAGGDPADDYLVAGLGDDLRDQLGQVAGLRLAARSSSIAARNQALGAIAASEKLGVAVLVEGSVRRRASNLVVSVELVDGESGLVIWSSAFRRTSQEILSVQQSMVDKILAQVSPELRQSAVRQSQTTHQQTS